MKNLDNLIKSIGCPNNKAGGGRIEFQDGWRRVLTKVRN